MPQATTAPRFENAPERRQVNRDQALRSYDPSINYRQLRDEINNEQTTTHQNNTVEEKLVQEKVCPQTQKEAGSIRI